MSHSGTFIAFKLPKGFAEKSLYLVDGEKSEDIHCTFFYQKGLTLEQESTVFATFTQLLKGRSIPATLGGWARFSANQNTDGKDVIVVLVDSPELTKLHAEFIHELHEAGIPYEQDHGYTSHITVKYVDQSEKLDFRRIKPKTVDLVDPILKPENRDVIGQAIEEVLSPLVSSAINKGLVASNGMGGSRANRGKPGYPVPAMLMKKDKSLDHLEDLEPHTQNMWKERLQKGEVRITEKVDGACRIDFGIREGKLWVRTKYTKVSESHDDMRRPSATFAFKTLKQYEPKLSTLGDFSAAGDVLYGPRPNTIHYDHPPGIVVHDSDGVSIEDICSATDNSCVPAPEISFNPKGDIYEQVYKCKSRLGGEFIEGVVLKHIPTNEMVKVVDRKTFTEANLFLWKFGDFATKGVKLEGKWLPGITRRLREEIATTLNVRTLLSPTTLKKIEEKCKNKGMKLSEALSELCPSTSIGSTARIRNIIRERRDDLKKLRKMWANAPRSMVTSSGHKISHDKSTVDRTEKTFDDVENKLDNLDLDLDLMTGLDESDAVYETLKHILPSTIKNRLFEAGSVFKTPTAPVRTSNVPGANPVTGAGDGVINKNDARKLLLWNREGLKKKGIYFGDEPYVKGAGTRGVAIMVNGDRVLKITGDTKEAKAAMKMAGKDFKHVARIFDVFKFKDSEAYGILQEELEPLSIAEEREIDEAVTGLAYALSKADYDWSKVRKFIPGEIQKHTLDQRKIARDKGYEDKVDWEELYDKRMAGVENTFKKLVNTWKFPEMSKELASVGVKFHDFHGGNIMKRGSDYVLIDPGFSEVSGAVEPPELSERLKRINERKTADMIGVTIGRFQPFHKGHASIIRELVKKYTRVVIFVAGNKHSIENPFSFETRKQLIQASLSDYPDRIEIRKADTGYIPDLLDSLVLEKDSETSIDPGVAVTVLVGPDRVEEFKKQTQYAAQDGKEHSFNPSLISVQGVPGLIDETTNEIISGTSCRDAIRKDDEDRLKQLLDPQIQGPEFDEIYEKLWSEMQKFTKKNVKQEAYEMPKKVSPVAAQAPVKKQPEYFKTFGDENGVMSFLSSKSNALKKKGIDINSFKKLGSGQDGIAFDMGGNKVFKITVDEGEAKSSGLLKIKGQNLKHIVRVFEAFEFSENGPYGIVLEKLSPLSSQEKSEMDKLAHLLPDDRNAFKSLEDLKNHIKTEYYKNFEVGVNEAGVFSDTTKPAQTSTSSPVSKTVRPQQVARQKGSELGQQGNKKTLADTEIALLWQKIEKFSIDKMVEELASMGIEYADYHGGNLMKRGNDYVITDLGRSVSGPSKLEKLADNFIRKFVESLGSTNALFTQPGSVEVSKLGKSAFSSGKMSQGSQDIDWQKGATKRTTGVDGRDRIEQQKLSTEGRRKRR